MAAADRLGSRPGHARVGDSGARLLIVVVRLGPASGCMRTSGAGPAGVSLLPDPAAKGATWRLDSTVPVRAVGAQRLCGRWSSPRCRPVERR